MQQDSQNYFLYRVQQMKSRHTTRL